MRVFWGLLLLSVAFCGAAEHPRLFFTDAAVAHLKTPDGIARMQPLAKKGNIDGLSLAYRVTGDKQYAQRVRDILLRDCRQLAPGEALKPWPNGLGGAHKCFDIALGYDCIYDFLSPEERKTIASSLISRGIEPMLNGWLLGKTRTTVLDSMGHNWWSSCTFLPGVAVLAVMDEEPRAKDWLRLIRQNEVEWFNYPGSLLNNKPANFDPDGAFYESVNYASYALSCYLYFRLACKNALAEPLVEIPLLDKAGDFFIHACYPNSGGLMSLNFGDSSLHAVGSQPLVLLWANGIRKQRYLWYLNQTTESDFREGIRPDSPFGLVYYPSDKERADAPATPDLPLTVTYKGIGWAMLRDSWDRNATLLGIKSGFTWNHAHADAGSFILFHQGENLLIDSGNCWYPHPQYDQYYRQSQAHNVVLFDGKGENPEDTYFGSKFPGTVSHLIDAGDLKYVLADATGPMAQYLTRNYRSFLWLDDVILVIDDLKAHSEGQFEWLLHVDGEAKRNGLDLEIRKGNAKIAVRPLFPERFPEGFAHDAPERMKLVERDGLKDHQQDLKVTYYSFMPPAKARVLKFVNAILLNPQNAPRIERLETDKAIGVRIWRESKTTDIWFNLQADGRMRHRNSNNTLGGWDTDAYLLAISTEQGKPQRFFIANGSYLRQEGMVLLDSLTKVFAGVDNGKARLYHP